MTSNYHDLRTKRAEANTCLAAHVTLDAYIKGQMRNIPGPLIIKDTQWVIRAVLGDRVFLRNRQGERRWLS